MKIGRLIARALIGGLFIGHGTQKWFGWFGGPGLDRASAMMDKLGMRPGNANAVLASGTETIGGAMLVTGTLTPVAAAGLIATMITAIRKVHLKNGVWAANGGYEFNLALIAGILALVDGGPGKLSVDGALGLSDTGPGWALAALGAGAIGSTVAIELGNRQPEQAPVPGTEAVAADRAAEAEPVGAA